ncbi:MAG: type II toxin-antitoxin system RelE/ParE family toxin [Synergistaceae bacterium]|nr:type II toxin-antitoxin system RelE/ParE family toxin [Synergistaceae bacterium]MBQ3449695.1 type II toxin-antitoxin system RelE/ParE family toxin [Synergistaceae bacterium]MBQ3694710.1 type II toxin-antitoxin system RelE/ParE family toxin [Synergistaceae bacterium]MBQ6111624.1 type II toxin-antitoxin system RelE/ParE family toxin [Synergistaceae bacterium]MBQ9628399.1 type II toxin-antitoxin system RelE/ParE family toxin [Synergistaceae bacterium]
MASRYSITYSRRAQLELDAIHAYIAEQFEDEITADLQTERIAQAAKTLVMFPKLYRVRRKNAKGQELRYMPVDNFMIIYYVDDSKNIVKVLHIVYGRCNIDSLI